MKQSVEFKSTSSSIWQFGQNRISQYKYNISIHGHTHLHTQRKRESREVFSIRLKLKTAQVLNQNEVFIHGIQL